MLVLRPEILLTFTIGVIQFPGADQIKHGAGGPVEVAPSAIDFATVGFVSREPGPAHNLAAHATFALQRLATALHHGGANRFAAADERGISAMHGFADDDG